MIFNPSLKNRTNQKNSHLLEQQIEQVESLANFGQKYDDKLSWEAHINQLSKKLSRAYGVIRKIEPIINSLFLKNLYYCMVHNHLKYGIFSWGKARKM